MGIAYGVTTNFQATKGIVQDGLVLNLDAGVKESYNGGTTFNDLQGNYSGSMINMNSSNYNKEKGGSFSFDGTDEYISTSAAIDNSSTHTISVFFKINSFNSSDMRFFGPYSGASTQSATGWTSTSVFKIWAGNGWHNTNITSSTDTIYQIAIVHDSNDDNHVYLNGSLNTTVANKYSWFVNMGFGNNFLLQWGSKFNGDIYNAQIYNRALTAAEVSRNFNVMRHRFGI